MSHKLKVYLAVAIGWATSAGAVLSITGVAFTQPTQANGVFATVPDGVADRLRESFRFYDWDASKNEVRWMCSFDTTEDDIDAFIAAIARETTGA